MNIKNWSLKTKLIATCMGIAIGLGVASFLLLRHLVTEHEHAIGESMESMAVGLDNALGAQFFERYGDVQAFAINPSIQARSKATIVEALNNYAALYGIYDLILVVSANGQLVAVNDKDPTGKPLKVESLYNHNFANDEWFKSTMAGKFTEDKAKNFAGTLFEDVHIDPYVSEVLGEKRLGNSFSAQIKDANGKPIGAISNRAGSRWFEVAFIEAYGALKREGWGDSRLTLLSKDGTVLFDYFRDSHAKEGEPMKYDWDSLLKTNLAKEGNEAAQKALAGETSNEVFHEKRHGAEVISGFTRVVSAKVPAGIDWAVLIQDDVDEAFAVPIAARRNFAIVMSIALAVAGLVGFTFAQNLARNLAQLAGHLSKGSENVATAAQQISSSSVELSEASTEQASAIQETAASVDEVSAMIKKNSENASLSQKTSEKSKQSAEDGQTAIARMITAINDISTSNERIMNQVIEGNRKVSEIVHVIGEIGNKTKVINDIVFQTKLLSFNASVEAARAGEHGKGFAVVAEEVGNLAQMSGNAAKEISEMLDGSLQRVESIVNETKESVERLVAEGKTLVESGKATASNCGESLTAILSSVREVDTMVAEIASASREQSQGIDEINKAMNQLDQVTQQNTHVAQQSADAADQLNSQSQRLKSMVEQLTAVITGRAAPLDGTVTLTPMAEEPRGKILSMPKRKAAPAPAPAPVVQAKEHKPASGGSLPAPSQDDPRFEEI